jgi:hypothetical protein
MKQMKKHKAILDISAHLVHLDSPAFSKILLQLLSIASLQASIHAIHTKSLD